MLERCFQFAKGNESGFHLSDGILYHNDKVMGQDVQQVCLPQSHRKQVSKASVRHLLKTRSCRQIGREFVLMVFTSVGQSNTCAYRPKRRHKDTDALNFCSV